MIIKKYVVGNMNEAVTRIRYELGNDAVIISQRKIRKKGIKGIFAKGLIEVTAAVESKVKVKNDDIIENNNDSMKESIEALKKVINNENKISQKGNEISQKDNIKISSKLPTTKKSGNEELLKEMHEMKNMINNMVNSKKEEVCENNELITILKKNDVEDDFISEIVANVSNADGDCDDIEKAKDVIEEMIEINEDELSGVVVLVGPTGIGKTTTIAKLAGRLALMNKKKVGLITVDTYRIGAVEQLKTYADIMNLPFKVVFTIKEMENAVDSMKECDAIIIDTTGRSSKNKMQISELRAFIDKVNADYIHLVVSCTTKNKDIDPIIDGYKILNYDSVIITKLDETSTYGSILNILLKAQKPLSYITMGQNVPDDIKKVDKKYISELILGVDE